MNVAALNLGAQRPAGGEAPRGRTADENVGAFGLLLSTLTSSAGNRAKGAPPAYGGLYRSGDREDQADPADGDAAEFVAQRRIAERDRFRERRTEILGDSAEADRKRLFEGLASESKSESSTGASKDSPAASSSPSGNNLSDASNAGIGEAGPSAPGANATSPRNPVVPPDETAVNFGGAASPNARAESSAAVEIAPRPAVADATKGSTALPRTVTVPSVEESGGTTAGTTAVRRGGETSQKVVATTAAADARTVSRHAQKAQGQERQADPSRMEKNIGRIAKLLRATIAQRGEFVRLQLDPPELGRVRIDLRLSQRVSGDVASLNVSTETDAARDALRSGEALLRDALARQGIHLDRLDFAPAGAGFDGASGANSALAWEAAGSGRGGRWDNGDNWDNRDRREHGLDGTESAAWDNRDDLESSATAPMDPWDRQTVWDNPMPWGWAAAPRVNIRV